MPCSAAGMDEDTMPGSRLYPAADGALAIWALAACGEPNTKDTKDTDVKIFNNKDPALCVLGVLCVESTLVTCSPGARAARARGSASSPHRSGCARRRR